MTSGCFKSNGRVLFCIICASFKQIDNSWGLGVPEVSPSDAALWVLKQTTVQMQGDTLTRQYKCALRILICSLTYAHFIRQLLLQEAMAFWINEPHSDTLICIQSPIWATKALIDTRLGARFCLWKTDRQSADVGLRGFVMDLPTLQNYVCEERRPVCIMDEGGARGPAFSCPTTKGRTGFQKRKEVCVTVSWRLLEDIIFHKKGELTFILFYHPVQSEFLLFQSCFIKSLYIFDYSLILLFEMNVVLNQLPVKVI